MRRQTDTDLECLNHERVALRQQLGDDNARLQAAAAMTDHVDRVSNLAEIREHIRSFKPRLTEIENELISLNDKLIDEQEVATAVRLP